MKSIHKSKKKLITIENVVMTILVCIIIAITALGMTVKYYNPNNNDIPEPKNVSELNRPFKMDQSLVVKLD